MFGSNMVIQRGVKAPVWGTARPGEAVRVSFAGQEKTATAGKDGSWMLHLDPLEASSQGRELAAACARKNGSSKTFTNVVVGEVWFCSGQSNMELGLGGIANLQAELEDSDYPGIRVFLVSKDAQPFPVENLSASWREGIGRNLLLEGWNGFSAVAYTFGRKLHKELGVPVGLIQSAFGGSPAHPWIPPEDLRSTPGLAPYSRMIEEADKTYQEDRKRDSNAMHPFAGVTEWDRLKPGTLYNAMVHPVAPFAVRGFLWYQGESDVGKAAEYPIAMKAMISGWRRIFRRGDIPFLFVQLPPYDYGAQGLLSDMWEAQAACLSIPNTGMAAAIDVGDPKDIHPTRKREVGERLALLALVKAYGRKDVECSGPVFRGMKISGDKAIISFDHAERGLASRDGAPLSDFTISGSDMRFIPAQAVISGNTVIVQSREVGNPAAVRFAWSNLAAPNLRNAGGFPAMPFRTDA